METSANTPVGTPAETDMGTPVGTSEIVRRAIGGLRRLGRKLGPYLMLELLLPGGTLLALLLFLYRRGLQNPA